MRVCEELLGTVMIYQHYFMISSGYLLLIILSVLLLSNCALLPFAIFFALSFSSSFSSSVAFHSTSDEKNPLIFSLFLSLSRARVLFSSSLTTISSFRRRFSIQNISSIKTSEVRGKETDRQTERERKSFSGCRVVNPLTETN